MFATGTIDGIVYGQAFTTGTHADGYRLTSIEARLRVTGGTLTDSQRKKVKAELWSSRLVSTAPTPNTKIIGLTTPDSIASGNSNVSFAVPESENITLQRTTQYFLLIYVDDTSKVVGRRVGIHQTTSDNEDSNPATGWSIWNERARLPNRYTPAAGNWLHSNQTFLIRVNGSAITAPTTLTLSTDAADDTAAEDAGTVSVTATLDQPARGDGVAVTLAAGRGSTATATAVSGALTLTPANWKLTGVSR